MSTVSDSDRELLANLAGNISAQLRRIACVDEATAAEAVLNEKLRPKTLTHGLITDIRIILALASDATAGRAVEPTKVTSALEFGPHVLTLLESTPHHDYQDEMVTK